MSERVNANDMMAYQQWWETRVLEEEERTPDTRFERALEEIVEFLLAHREYQAEPTVENGRAAAEEMVDVLIVGMGYIDSLGYDPENLFVEKMERNHIKYNVVKNRELRAGGMTSEQALQRQKNQWNLANGE